MLWYCIWRKVLSDELDSSSQIHVTGNPSFATYPFPCRHSTFYGKLHMLTIFFNGIFITLFTHTQQHFEVWMNYRSRWLHDPLHERWFAFEALVFKWIGLVWDILCWCYSVVWLSPPFTYNCCSLGMHRVLHIVSSTCRVIIIIILNIFILIV